MSLKPILTCQIIFLFGYTLCSNVGLGYGDINTAARYKNTQESVKFITDIIETMDRSEPSNTGNRSNDDVITICKAYLTEYAKQSSSFTKCLVENARPFRFCEGCVGFYEKAANVFNDMTTDKACSKEILLADRVQVVRMVNSNMESIWQNAYCNDCFSSINENATTAEVIYTLKNTTRKFLDLFFNVTTCLNTSIQLFDPDMITDGNSSYCDVCRPHYKSLNNFYTSHIQSSSVCMDIVDMMNYTRLMWSKSLNCSHRVGDLMPVLIITSVICALPIIFYVVNRLLPGHMERTIVIQKRMKFPRTNSYASMSSSQQSFNTSTPRDSRPYGAPVRTTIG